MATNLPPTAISHTATHFAVARPDAALDLFTLPAFTRSSHPPPATLTPTALALTSSTPPLPVLATSSGALYLSSQPLPSLPGPASALAATATHLLAAAGPARSLVLLSLSPPSTLASSSLLPLHRAPISALALSADLSRAVVCSQAVTLIHPRTGKLLRSFTGHAAPVSSAAFLPGGLRLITASAADRFISVWDADLSSDARPPTSVKRRRKSPSPVFPPVATLLAPQTGVVAVAVDQHESTGASVAAILASGAVAVWRNWTEKSAAGKPTECSFVLNNTPRGGNPVPVFAAAFGSVGDLTVVYGSALKPTMARFKLAEVEGSVMLPPCATDVLVSKAVQQKRSAKHKAVEGSSIPALQRTDDRKMNGERRDKGEDVGEEEDGDGDDNNKNVNVDVDVDEDEEPSIQQKLVALGISQGDGDFGASKAFPNASGEKSILGSRANVLMQAIRAQDQSLFDDTIEKMRDVKLIRTTVERLPQSVAAGDLLDMLVDRLQRFPTKAETLARWIREVLMEHTGALMSQQRNKALVALVEIVKERTQALEGLSRLQGRLELVLTRADKLKRAGRTMTGDAEPKAQYEEEEGSEDESDESSDDSDSEAGSEDAEDETGELDSEQSSSEDGSGSEMEDVAVRVPERAPRQGDIAMKKMNGHGPGDKIGRPDSSSDEI